MPRTPSDEPKHERRPDAPRTDLPPRKEPYYEGYFGTEDPEAVVREEDEAGKPRRDAGEEAAGGDREII
jgi:hypothetical protein